MKPFTTIKPIGDQILVEPVTPEEKTKGGIYIPEAYREQTLRARVLAVGTGKRDKRGKLRPTGVRKGDIVAIGGAAASDAPIKLAGKECLMIMEGDIFGVVEPA